MTKKLTLRRRLLDHVRSPPPALPRRLHGVRRTPPRPPRRREEVPVLLEGPRRGPPPRPARPDAHARHHPQSAPCAGFPHRPAPAWVSRRPAPAPTPDRRTDSLGQRCERRGGGEREGEGEREGGGGGEGEADGDGDGDGARDAHGPAAAPPAFGLGQAWWAPGPAPASAPTWPWKLRPSEWSTFSR